MKHQFMILSTSPSKGTKYPQGNALLNMIVFNKFLFQYFRYIEIGIKQCRSSGIDCKVHGLTILGRLRSDEDDAAANFSFLASDREEEEDDKVVSSSLKKKKKSATKEIQTNVFCWGLNDKDQLGGPKGSKVSFFN